VAELYGRFGPRLWAILLMVALYRMPDFVSGVMANPLYRAVGYSLTEIAAVTKLYGIWVGIFASFVAGWAIARFGMHPTFIVGGALAAGSHLSLAWLAYGPPEVWRLTVAISIDNFGGGFAGTALIAYMSGLTGAGFAASQYALLSSLYALPGKLAAGSAGFVVAAFGFPVFFAFTASIGIPVVILCVLVGKVPRSETSASEMPPDAAGPGEAKPA
jgi:PAT family beta-lactamase induction signal transducer AmpG